MGSSRNIFFSACQNVLYTHRYSDIWYFLVEIKILIKRKHQQAVEVLISIAGWSRKIETALICSIRETERKIFKKLFWKLCNEMLRNSTKTFALFLIFVRSMEIDACHCSGRDMCNLKNNAYFYHSIIFHIFCFFPFLWFYSLVMKNNFYHTFFTEHWVVEFIWKF